MPRPTASELLGGWDRLLRNGVHNWESKSSNKHLFLDYETIAGEVYSDRHWVAPVTHEGKAIEDPRPETTAKAGGGRHIDRE